MSYCTSQFNLSTMTKYLAKGLTFFIVSLWLPFTWAECLNWQSSHPEWIFCDDFESKSISTGQGGYFEYDTGGGLFTPTNGIGFNGSYGMKAHFNKGTTNAGNLKLVFGRNPMGDRGIHSTRDFREIYYRIYFEPQVGWQGFPDKFSRATVFAKNDWSQAMIAHVWNGNRLDGSLAMDPAGCIDTNGNVLCTGYNDFSHLKWLGLKNGTTKIFSQSGGGKWYCVESHVKLNDPGQANGVQEFWVDGNLEASATNLDLVGKFTAYGINAVFIENFWNNGSIQDQDRYFDNFVVSTKPIGCNPNGPVTPPFSRPSPPQNFQVK